MKQKNACCSLLLGLLVISTSAFADSPREFLQKALQGDNSEIMLGRLAAERARSPRVRDFGTMLVTDHSLARDEVIRVAGPMGIHDDPHVAPEAREERRRLYRMDGRDFDREFVRYMVDDHRKDVADFREEASENHGRVSDLARRQLPTLQHHLEMAMDLDRRGDRRDDGGYDHRGEDHRNDGINDQNSRGANDYQPSSNDPDGVGSRAGDGSRER